ncbi:ATPase [Trypanosoma cruzi]|nr:ATPase [Trypanosoma cruzi]
MTTALCASPAARMRRGRDERRAEGAVTCGRATRACGAEHTFLPSCFVFFAASSGRHPQHHTHSHTLPPCFFFCFLLFCFVDVSALPPCVIVDVGAVPLVPKPSSCSSCCVDLPPCALLLFSSSHSTRTQSHEYLHSAMQECICFAGCWPYLLFVRWRVMDGATMASSGNDSRCALGTHTHTLPSL